jgi:magnesium chelatase subunit I
MNQLLDDHLVDVLLYSAASGWNTVEREGMYHSSIPKNLSSRFRKPEGELRPQLLDRFECMKLYYSEPNLRVKIRRKKF